MDPKKKVYVDQIQINKPSIRILGEKSILIKDIDLEKKIQCIPKNIPLKILHEDDSIIVIDKPYNLCVHPGTHHEKNTLMHALIYHFPILKNIPRAGIVHRLDKDTSGLMIVAKKSSIQNQMMKLFKSRKVYKEYEAIVYGNINSDGTIDKPIKRHPYERIKNFVCDFGRKAKTHYYVKEKFVNFTRIILSLESGRHHQARVHMKYIGHPIVGDYLYQDRQIIRKKKNYISNLIKIDQVISRQALHARKIKILHPQFKKKVTWKSNIPEDMRNLIDLIRKNEK
ncbi:RluA family pseudouridine synthase [Candidatus Riesia pediculicola]|uniref:RluA family pseudouridine synthase n=1 Tax=Candidatus Riesia pediculicola TaxID=401619 RepID=UPI0009C39074|nr:RluA family pseudouridine synthase [Candidatus Riesia pediculicola]ARC54063.1 hypothetical protein AOE57_00255 [Candidatus Riesia pediculicola]